MAPLPPLDSLSHAEKDALILALLARVEELCARVAELEAKLGLPPKTPDNSPTPAVHRVRISNIGPVPVVVPVSEERAVSQWIRHRLGMPDKGL